jgi:hypothetical protein
VTPTGFASFIRKHVKFWIYAPLFVALVSLALMELGGRWVGPNAQGLLGSLGFGVGLFVALVLFVAAHMAFAAAMLGMVGVIFGGRSDWRLYISVLVGVSFGGGFLYRIYFS